MRAFSLALLAASGTALVTATVIPVSAQLARPQTVIGVTGGNDLVTEVQWRRGGYRGGYRGRHYGPGAGLGIGLATGALIGGALAAPYYAQGHYGSGYYAPAPRVYYGAPVGSGVAYCMRRFKSYDPASGTYLGYDGMRHACP